MANRTKSLQRVHKNTVKAKLRSGEQWTGYLCASNVAAYHVRAGWHCGCRVTATSIDDLNEKISNYAYYNCNNEMGYEVRLWEWKENA
jgi:hypothetical protein